MSPAYQSTFLDIINKNKVPVTSIKQYISRNLENPTPEPIDPSWSNDEFKQLFMRVAATMALGNMQAEKSMINLMNNINVTSPVVEEAQPVEQLQYQNVLNNFYSNPNTNSKLTAINRKRIR